MTTSPPSLFLRPIAAPEEVEAGGAVPEGAWVAVAVPEGGAAVPEAFPLRADVMCQNRRADQQDKKTRRTSTFLLLEGCCSCQVGGSAIGRETSGGGGLECSRGTNTGDIGAMYDRGTLRG